MSIARHHAEWLSLVEISGPFLSMPVLLRVFPQGLDAHDPEVSKAVRRALEEWQDNQQGLRPDLAIHTAWVRFVLREVLGLPWGIGDGGWGMEGVTQFDWSRVTVTIPEHAEILRPTIVISQPPSPTSHPLHPNPHPPSPIPHPPRLLIQIVPPTQDLDKPLKDHRWKASPATRMAELLRGTGVRLGLLTNGERWMLVHAQPGETAGFSSWYASLWLDEPVTLRAFRSLLGVARFYGVADPDTLELLLTESASNQQEVTDQLGYQVREAVEVLVQTFDRIDKDQGRALLQDVRESMLYEAALTVMMRLVFLFSAEERGLLLLGKPMYDQHYAISTLRAQLRAAADETGEEVLERRHDAWSRLLATFRAVFGGVQHEDLRLPAYGGHLFDPERFPFLGDGGWRTGDGRDGIPSPIPHSPPPIDNRTVLHLLEALQVLRVSVPGGGPAEPRRLSFRALDIEQIGHVYEGMLDHTAKRAAEPVLGLVGSKDREPEIPLATLEAMLGDGGWGMGDRKPELGRQKVEIKREALANPSSPNPQPPSPIPHPLLTFLHEETGRSASALEKALVVAIEPHDLDILRAACDNDDDLVARVRPFAGLLRRDTFGRPVVITTGSVYVTAGTDRRSSGTHYTPRSLTEPIVQHTLDPLVYHGPAEGLPKEQWTLHPAERILALQVCDMAMGSGAFLVQTCRYLSERLVEAWEMYGDGGSGVGGRGSGVEDRGVDQGGVSDGNPNLPQSGSVAAEHGSRRGDAGEGRQGITITGRSPNPQPPSPIPDPDERLAQARRMIADRCLYGVDKNPLAVEMAKLSLWLITLQKDRPFSFLDHALRAGDSLLGLAHIDQLLHWSLARDTGPITATFLTEPLRRAIQRAMSLRRRIRETPVRDVRDAERKAAWLREAEDALGLVRLAADLLVSAALHPEKKQREQKQQEFLDSMFVAAQAFEEVTQGGAGAPKGHANQEALATLRREADALLAGRQPFHWPLEFPEVFLEEVQPVDVGGQQAMAGFGEVLGPLFGALEVQSLDQNGMGFSAIVGNPPFQGGQKITGALGVPYRDYVVEYLAGSKRGSADLCAYFFLRAGGMLQLNGQAGLIATNTIAQGDTREVGLDQLISNDLSIFRAVPTRKWPGTASLEVAYLWLRKGSWLGNYYLDENQVTGISPMLTVKGEALGNPHRVSANANLSFMGSVVLGLGFVLSHQEAQEIIEKDNRNSAVLFGYLGGQDLNFSLEQLPSRSVINFHDWPLEDAEKYPLCMSIVREKVYPDRQRNNDKQRREIWWRFTRPTVELYQIARKMRRILAVAQTGKYHSFVFVSPDFVYDQKLIVFAFDDDANFSLLQSTIHREWVLKYGSSLKLDPVYTPTDCFETFPFPACLQAEHSTQSRKAAEPQSEETKETSAPLPLRAFALNEDPPSAFALKLESIGEAYHTHRQQIMRNRQEGLTKTYNRFHTPTETADDIAELRRLHVEMDNAVAAAYGWQDLDLGHGFHQTKQGLRYTISEAARRTVLDRLLALNHARYAEEVAEGLHDKGGSRKGAKAQRGGKGKVEGQGELL